MKTIGLSPHLLEWIRSYLTDRQQRVVVGGEASHVIPVLSDVPQGFGAGSFAILLYINDITETQL